MSLFFSVSLALDSDFWEDLIIFIEEGRVIPVIGESIVTFGAKDENLYAWLALRLADKLQVRLAQLPPDTNQIDPVVTLLDQSIAKARQTRPANRSNNL